MQKVLIGVLALAALFFAAANARLSERLRVLEGRLSSAESKARPRAVAAAPERVEPAAAPPATPPPSAPSTTVLDRAQTYVARAVEDVDGLLGNVRTKFLVLNRKPLAEELSGLSEAQKRAIDDLKRNRDLQTKVYKDQIKVLEDQTDLAIRQLLNPEQQQEQARAQELDVFTQVTSGQEFVSPDVPKSGYLGVAASNAPGGGAKIDQVMPDSAASAFGLQAGDVLLDFSGEKISDVTGLTTKIHATVEGAAVVLKISRGGTEFYQNVVLGARR